MKITRDLGELAAAHRLMNHEGMCEYLHGHNWAVAVWVEAPLGENGIAIDFLAFDSLKKKLYEELDHGIWLNSQDSLCGVLKENNVRMKLLEVDGEPTAENIALLILERLKKAFPQGSRWGVNVAESAGCVAGVEE